MRYALTDEISIALRRKDFDHTMTVYNIENWGTTVHATGSNEGYYIPIVGNTTISCGYHSSVAITSSW